MLNSTLTLSLITITIIKALYNQELSLVSAHWDINLMNRDGINIKNSGVTIIHLKFGKAVLVKDYLFDIGDKF